MNADICSCRCFRLALFVMAASSLAAPQELNMLQLSVSVNHRSLSHALLSVPLLLAGNARNFSFPFSHSFFVAFFFTKLLLKPNCQSNIIAI
jgi:hypothetical protein